MKSERKEKLQGNPSPMRSLVFEDLNVLFRQKEA